MNRTEVLEKIQPLVEGQVRDIQDASRTRVNVTPDMITLRPSRGARLIEVAPEGAKAIVGFTGLPLGIVKQLSPSTFGQALSEILSRTGKYSLVLKENRMVNLVKYGQRRAVHPERLLDTIERVVPVQDYPRVITIEQTASIEVVGERTQPVVRGDLVRAGVKVAFSPMGMVTPVVQSYALVLSCTNGATANNVLAEFTGGGGDGDNIWQFFRESIRQAYNSFSQVVEGWKKLASEQVPPEDRAIMLEALIKQAKLPRNVADAVRSLAIENPPQNTWEMHNLLTYASSHLLEAPEQIRRTQSTAADFADEERHARACPLCHRNR